MFPVLLAAVSPYAFTLVPKAKITFPGAAPQIISGPANTDQTAVDDPWTLDQILYAPSKNAAAVRFCWDIGKYGDCETKLARPGQPVLTLLKGNVTQLLWTADGKYLLGARANTLRLWNLAGGVRTAVPTPGANEPGWVVGSLVSRIWLSLGRQGQAELCVATTDFWSKGKTGAHRNTMTTTRYALPTLSALTITTFPQQQGKEAECRPFSSSDLE
ncbi:hypothetical protein ACFFLM_10880 [Deinococcus oregonensis]|uniref:Uncharacterized protein n=1 Tax=Deinococcus oregonensis TaxID=1805970 RepID=A0ABV6AYF4_9DEIO